jgi:DNA-binding NtrC family response regulator
MANVIDMRIWLDKKKPFRTKKILIVDDVFGMRESIRMIAKVYGATAVTATDTYEALQILDADSFDLITTDLRRPGLSGIDFIKEIRARGLSTPIIIITGFGSLRTITAATECGVSDYLAKPWKVADIISSFKKALAV